MGGVSVNSLAREFKSLLANMDVPPEPRFYDLRGSVNTDLNSAGVSHLCQQYLTGHAVAADILSQYVSLDLHAEMETYFRYIRPLLTAIQERSIALKITAE